MQKWYHIFQRSTGLSPYVWVIFYILPFYFIFSSTSMYESIIGIALVLMFFACYVLSFVSKGRIMYFWTAVQILISVTMTVLFGYVYFSLFLAFFIGNIQHKVGFITMYCIHLVTTFVTINYGFLTMNPVMLSQIPFILVSVLGVVLLPVTTYNRNKREKLEVQLEDANKRISELVKLEERQRIARDLHDTLGQRLSLIGLKSDLASKLITKNPVQAQAEIKDVRQAARSALKEVRELVTQMRGARLDEEMFRVEQILKAAQIEFSLKGNVKLPNTSLLNENVLSMCVKEAVTNIVRHSHAAACSIEIESSATKATIKIEDNGVGLPKSFNLSKGNGLQGMKERLEFVNGTMEMIVDKGTTLVISVPNVFKASEQEVGKS
ncbi:sensor histidine kinase [Paenibacillus agilis]|uniref:histidine kinase n=1 Tax=Paenibacillus agilis TaxID=3020863 RepID=A0A559IGP1_9BACL|nr:sensor histidine kinase [Paenibacillus agilis]TVX86822.1 sensor histidine kinase [Paenibacillus agilis]